MNFYNEIDPYAAQWLRNLIAAGEIPPGVVDERDIQDIRPDELTGFTQCHFFAGLGGWPLALRLAGWPDDRPVWTGSCPCQPFSAAGKGAGFADERHLWPAWFWLIAQCRPRVVFGEQVDKALAWLDLVSTDLEAEGYACGPIILPAASVGSPHGRHRLWFVAESMAYADRTGSEAVRRHDERDGTRRARVQRVTRVDGAYGELAHDGPQPAGRGLRGPGEGVEADGVGASGQSERSGTALLVAHGSGNGRQEERALAGRGVEGDRAQGIPAGSVSGDADSILGDADVERSQGRGVLPERPRKRAARASGVADLRGTSPTHGFWGAADWILCRDGKWRPVEPGTQQMVDGLSRAVGRLRAAAVVAEKVNGQTRQTVTSEIVCALRRGNDPFAVWQSLGRCLGFPAATLLLAALCEQSRELGSFFYGQTSRISEESKAVLREMPCNGQAACSSQGWQLPQQLLDELTDAMPTLSQAGAPLAGFTGHPLAHGVSNRVGRLRAYGNAIVPQLAAEVIRAYLEESSVR